MSQENVEIVLRQFQLWSEGNLDGWAQCWDRDVVVRAPEGWPEGEINHGLEAWRRQAERLRDSWDEARAEVDDIRAVGQDRVVTRIRYVTSGKDPGISFDTAMAAAFFLRDGKITRADYCWNFAEALEAVGLSE
jgi:ketosteroid isomerase-like protein